jgi:CheY-like chemotaxis protein
MTETKRFQILVAEDHQADTPLVREALKQHSVDSELSLISNGAQAIDYRRGLNLNPRQAAPDLVLFEMQRPKCDGVRAA